MALGLEIWLNLFADCYTERSNLTKRSGPTTSPNSKTIAVAKMPHGNGYWKNSKPSLRQPLGRNQHLNFQSHGLGLDHVYPRQTRNLLYHLL